MDSVLMPNEIDLFIDTMVAQDMKQIGSEQWIDGHNRVQKLNQEAAVEAATMKEEHVKEALVASCGKAKILVHEAILINIWKFKVLPLMLKLEPNPESTFLAYSVLYHEAVCVSLLELVMFHANCCEALDEASVDLLDYSCGCVSLLLSLEYQESSISNKENATEELMRQRSNLGFEIGIRCLTILRYLTENSGILPIAVTAKLYQHYDVPILLTECLLKHPWNRNEKIYIGGKWKDWDQEQLGPAEAQVWLNLRHLLLDPECKNYYQITQSRRNHLVQLLPRITPNLLDQLSPLIDLKIWLSHAACLDEFAASATTTTKPFILELVLNIKENILRKCKGKWKKIAENQLSTVFTSNTDDLQEAAKKLTEAFNTDLLEQFEVKEAQKCAQCGCRAIQRCSKCQKSWYCSRNCQVQHWTQHKETCTF